jgi:hypothetical protein
MFDVEPGDEAERLARCVVRRVIGDPEATPDLSGGEGLVRVTSADDAEAARQFVEAAGNECAAELGIDAPELLVRIRR